MAGIGAAAGDEHTENIHHHHAGQIKEVKSQCAPAAFNHHTNGIEAEQADGYQQQIQPAAHAAVGGQGVGEQPPDLPLEDGSPVKAQQVVKKIILGKHTQ